MDSDRPTTVALNVSAAWRGVIDGLDTADALNAFAERIVRATLEAAVKTPWLMTGEVSLLLTDDQEIQSLNSTYRSRDHATNVLSFPGLDLVAGEADMLPPPGPAVLGDIVMSAERLNAEASVLEKAPIDHAAHLLVHGTLHLLGFDHVGDDEAQVMEALEARVLETLGFAAPYAPPADAPISDGSDREATTMSTVS